MSDSRCAHSTRLASASLAVVIGLVAGRSDLAAQTKPMTLVVCAPGYPGSTSEAQPAMDGLAAAAAARAGWGSDALRAVYFEDEKAGLDRLAAADAAVALVPLPFWLKHRETLKLVPHLQAIEQGGEAAESWTLVAPAGLLSGPSSLADFELVTISGYAPRFVRGPALANWGELPPEVRITASNNVISALRRASAGSRVAVLLDRASAAAMPTLPFASKLQVVSRSAPLPVAVLSAVGDRLPSSRLNALVKGLTSLDTTRAGKEALSGVRLARFVAADQAALAKARALFDRARE